MTVPNRAGWPAGLAAEHPTTAARQLASVPLPGSGYEARCRLRETAGQSSRQAKPDP